MTSKYVYFCGSSYAWHEGYLPRAFHDLDNILVGKSEEDPKTLMIDNKQLVDQIQDSYNKLGFIFLARKYIKEINGKSSLQHTLIPFHLSNFTYDCKAFLDAVAVLLNDVYSLGRNGGQIDFRHGRFIDAINKAEPKLVTSLGTYDKWIQDVINWRDCLIHKFSTTIAPYIEMDRWPTDEELTALSRERCMMPMEPIPSLSGNYSKLRKKYGKSHQEIEPFCDRWIKNACNFYDEVCIALLQRLR